MCLKSANKPISWIFCPYSLGFAERPDTFLYIFHKKKIPIGIFFWSRKKMVYKKNNFLRGLAFARDHTPATQLELELDRKWLPNGGGVKFIEFRVRGGVKFWQFCV